MFKGKLNNALTRAHNQNAIQQVLHDVKGRQEDSLIWLNENFWLSSARRERVSERTLSSSLAILKRITRFCGGRWSDCEYYETKHQSSNKADKTTQRPLTFASHPHFTCHILTHTQSFWRVEEQNQASAKLNSEWTTTTMQRFTQIHCIAIKAGVYLLLFIKFGKKNFASSGKMHEFITHF